MRKQVNYQVLKFGFLSALGSMLCVTACMAEREGKAPVCGRAETQARAALDRLTFEERASLTHGATTMTVAGIPAKGIPTFTMSDGPHTVRQELGDMDFSRRYPASDMRDASTVFPSLLCLASTWDPSLARRFGEAMGEEARSRGKDMMLGPGLNLLRTPLCGRNWEYMGEDPCLTARMGVQVVQGIQSWDVASCIKHFAANNQEWNRSQTDSRVDERTLRELYLPAFEAAIKEGGALAVMNGYNKLNGVFCSHNTWLNKTLLKEEWGFPGLVVTDWSSLHDTIEGVRGGTDLEMNRGSAIRFFKEPMLEAVKAGKLQAEQIDEMARRVLYVQAKLHKLDGQPRAAGSRNTPEHQALARTIAAEGTILLKNEGKVLPLDPKTLKRVLVVGQNAKTKHATSGWSAEGKPPYEITLWEGLHQALPGVILEYAPFPTLNATAAPLPDAVLLTENPNTLAGTGMRDCGWTQARFGNDNLSGVPKMDFVRAPEIKIGTMTPNFSVRWETTFRAPESGVYRFGGTYDDGLRLSLNGKVVLDDWKNGKERSRFAEIPLEAGQVYALRLEYRQAGGEARMTFGWVRPSEQGSQAGILAEQARRAEAVILVTGTRHGHGLSLECEGGDRPSMDLFPQDDAGIRALAGLNPKTVVVVNAGSPVTLPWLDRVPAVVLTSYAGQEAGHAVADVLLGKQEPGGRLPFSWPKRLTDSPAHALNDYRADYADYKEGVLMGYRWFDAKGIRPLFPFGHGLSYADFTLGEPVVEAGEASGVNLRISVTNRSARAGSTVVQGYIGKPVNAPEPSPVRRLGAFAKVFLQPGETREVKLSFPARAFAYWDVAMHGWQSPAGVYPLEVGFSSENLLKRTVCHRDAWSEPVAR